MSVNDIKVLKCGGEVRTYKVDDRNSSTVARTIKAGEPVKRSNNFVIRVEDGDPEIAADILKGIAIETSSETATADGTVDVVTLIPGQTVLRGKANTSTNADTAADLLGILNDYVAFDVSYTLYDTSNEGVITIDENEGDDPNVHGLCIIDGSADANAWLDVTVHVNVTEAGALVGQTMD